MREQEREKRETLKPQGEAMILFREDRILIVKCSFLKCPPLQSLNVREYI